MSGHGRHRLHRSNLLNRGIYWGSATTRATLATVVAVVAIMLMAAFAPNTSMPDPIPTAAQQSLPAAVAAWQSRVTETALTTAERAVEADSEPVKGKTRKVSCEG